MKLFLVLGTFLLACNGYAAQKLTSKGISYFPVFGLGTTYSVAYTGTQGSVAVTSESGSTYALARIISTTATYIDVGTNPNPSSAKVPLPANTEMIVEFLSGYKVGAIQQSSGGTLYVTALKINRD